MKPMGIVGCEIVNCVNSFECNTSEEQAMERIRNWCFTLNNYTEDEVTSVETVLENAEYGIFGKEVGEQGTPHLQGFVRFRNAKTFSAVKRMFPERTHFERARGTDLQNKQYCSKQGDYKEWGTLSGQGKRTDLQDMRKIIEATGSIRKVIEEATSIQAVRCAETLAKYIEPSRTEPPTVYWYYGSTGTGKTRTAVEEARTLPTWISQDGLQWFDGYDGEEHAVIDDFRAAHCTFSFLLRLLDRYPFRVPFKGGFRQWRANKIWITSPNAPRESFQVYGEEMEQLLRRISVIRNFDERPYSRPEPPRGQLIEIE